MSAVDVRRRPPTFVGFAYRRRLSVALWEKRLHPQVGGLAYPSSSKPLDGDRRCDNYN
jgi:hypothetical protein